MRINLENIISNIAIKNIKEVCKHEDVIDIDEYPTIFSNKFDDLHKINNKEYDIYIREGTDTIVLINGSKLLIKNKSDKKIGIENIKIISFSEIVTRMPLLKFDVDYENGSLYLISDFYQLKTGDTIKIYLEDEIENPEFIFINVLRLHT